MSRGDCLQVVMNHLAQMVTCWNCGTRIQFGDFECPHCGADVYEVLESWAQRLLDALDPYVDPGHGCGEG